MDTPTPPPHATPPEPPDEAAAASRKRMAFIVAYVRDPASNPLFADKPTVFQVLTAERTHQVGLLQAAEQELARLPPPPASLGMAYDEALADARLVAQEARRDELTKRVKQAKAVQAQIFGLLKQITGIQGLTGGEEYLPPPALPTTTEETTSEDAFDAANALLARMKKRPG